VGAQAESDGPGLAVVPPLDEPDERFGALLLEEFKGLAATQATQAERIGSRAQQTLAFVVAVFAVAQTAALSSFNSKDVSASDGRTVLVAAIASAVLLLVTALASLAAGLLRKYVAVGPDDVEAASDRAVDEHADLAVILAKRYKSQIVEGEGVLADKRKWLRVTEIVAVVTLLAVTAEIVLSLSARVG
jgi:hypothetical protein